MDSNDQNLDDFSVKGLIYNLSAWISFLLSKTKDILKLAFVFLVLTLALFGKVI